MYDASGSRYNRTMSTPTPQVIMTGSTVQYMGLKAFVVKGNEPAPEWTGHDEPTRFVNIRFTDKAPHGWSKQQDVFASACVIVRD